MDSSDSQIRRRPDGSIDIAHYTAHGRAARSAQAVALGAALLRRNAENPDASIAPAPCTLLPVGRS